MPNVTVIIPAYNAEPYIKQCADSILNQTLKDIEVIFINDGSTDQTGAILTDLVKGYPNARVIHQDNKGLYISREIGLSMATGDYIGWVDADDYVENNMYEVLYNVAIENNSELVICDYSWFPEKIATKGKWFREYKGQVDTTFVERNSQPWNKIVKRELLERLEVGKYFATCFDEIYIRLLMEAKNPVTVIQPLYHYRVSSGTMSSSYTNVAHYRRFVDASVALKNLMEAAPINDYWKDYFDYRIIYYLLMTMVVAAYSRDKEAYERNRNELFSLYPNFNENQHYWRILKENYGTLGSYAIGKIVPLGYSFAVITCSAKLQWGAYCEEENKWIECYKLHTLSPINREVEHAA